MKHILWLLKWLLKIAIFFTLFAFALNNQHDISVNFFFGRQWQAPLVLVVLTVFSMGVAVGVLGMLPRWFKHRVASARAAEVIKPATPPSPMTSGTQGYSDGI